ncbi:MAG: squalene synthase HpnC [Phycisphaeraceae bacterium]
MASIVLDQLATFGPHHCRQLDRAQADRYTAALTRAHGENFTVVSWLLPRRLRADFRHVYAFCRWADDLGDETGDTARSLELLAWWRDELARCYAGRPRHPVFVALEPTIERHDIPRKPFDDLIDAFVQDQQVTRYDTFEQVLDYCTRSADPVGRLVLYLCGHHDAERQRLSDATCTALQLANFWQDVRRDIVERDRVYLPADVAHRHGLHVGMMVNAVRLDADPANAACGSCASAGPGAGMRAMLPAYRGAIRELVRRTWPLFERGRGLWPLVEPGIRTDIKLFTLGGEAVLRRIERINYETLLRRPRIGRATKAALLVRALAGRLRPGGRGRAATPAKEHAR